MLARRLIACLDVSHGQVVKGVNFGDLKDAGDPVALAKRYNDEGIDELVMLDISATLEGRRRSSTRLPQSRASSSFRSPAGGGIRSLADARAVIEAGADKVSVNTAALLDPPLISAISETYGSQATVVAIDARMTPNGYEVVSRAGTSPAGRAPLEWAGAAATARRWRDIADVDQSRRYSPGLRLPADSRGERRRPHPLSSRQVEPARTNTSPTCSRSGGPTLHSPRLSFTSSITASEPEAVALQPEHSDAPHGRAMLIPSIDLMDGRIVQLERGERLVLATDDFETWVARFSDYPIVQLIDLDAAMGRGSNSEIVRDLCARLPCQVGGGVRTPERAVELLESGARRVIVGSRSSDSMASVSRAAGRFADAVPAGRLIAAVDSRGNRVVIHGWKTTLSIPPQDAVRQLEPYVRRVSIHARRRRGHASAGSIRTR
jgi:imidazole glycerol phosphate synthase subunit HisF